MSNQSNPEFYEYLAKRRSASILHDPKPSKTEIEKIEAKVQSYTHQTVEATSSSADESSRAYTRNSSTSRSAY